jgi:hypothetical protein
MPQKVFPGKTRRPTRKAHIYAIQLPSCPKNLFWQNKETYPVHYICHTTLCHVDATWCTLMPNCVVARPNTHVQRSCDNPRGLNYCRLLFAHAPAHVRSCPCHNTYVQPPCDDHVALITAGCCLYNTRACPLFCMLQHLRTAL